MKKSFTLYLLLLSLCNQLYGLNHVFLNDKIAEKHPPDSIAKCYPAIDPTEDSVFIQVSKSLSPDAFIEDYLNPEGEYRDTGSHIHKSYTVYVVQEGWHTGIIFETKDVSPKNWPEIINHQDKNFLDVGWGDEKFYQAPGFPVFIAARAVLWPTQAVMRVYAFNIPIRSAFLTGSRFLRIPLTGEQFAALCKFISESYITDEEGNPQTSTIYRETQVYFLSTRKYHLFRTCNTWVALAFRKAGLGNRSFLVLNKNQLLRQLSRIHGAEFL